MPNPLFSEIAQIIDCEHKSPRFENDGIPYVRTSDISQGRIRFENAKRISQDSFREWTRRAIPQPGDLILTRDPPIGNVGIVPKGLDVCLGQGTVLVRPNHSRVDSSFLMYLILGKETQSIFYALATGATLPHLNLEDLQEIRAPWFPPLPIQQRIGIMLSTYDDLIENNRRRIQLLEEMARSLYREWFVHFRFPGHEDVQMLDSELGEIPEGWVVSELGKESIIIAGLSPKSKFYNEEGEGLPFHQGVKDFGNILPTHRVYCTIGMRVAEPGDILFSVRAPVGRINLADTKLVIGRGLFAIRQKEGFQAHLLYQLKNIFYKEDMIGGGTVFQAVTKQDVSETRTLVPSVSVIRDFEKNARSMVSLILSLTKRNQILAGIRDLLLPKLVSGQLSVSNMELEIPPKTPKTSKYSDQSTLDQWLERGNGTS